MEAFAVALSQKWPDANDRLFRAWLLSMCHTIGSLGPTPTAPMAEGDTIANGLVLGAGPKFVARVQASTRPIHYDLQNTMAMCLGAIVSRGHVAKAELVIPDGQVVRVRSNEGDPRDFITSSPVSFNAAGLDTGQIGIVEGAVIVLCAGILAGAAGWIVSQVNEVRAIEATSQGKTTAAIAAMTTSAQMVETHAAAEQASGQQIEYSAQEKELLSTLQQAIQSTANWQPPKLQSVPDVSGATAKIGTGIGIGTAIALAVVAWVLLRKERG